MQPHDADAVFIETYLRHENRDDAAAIIAYRRAGYIEPQYPAVVAAERHLERLKDAIDSQRAYVKTSVKGEHSRESIMADVDTVFESALSEKDHSAAINAKRLQAQLQGMLQENVTVTHKVDVSMMTDDQLMRIINKKSLVVEGDFKEVSTPKGIGHLKPVDDRTDASPGS